jgi:hypothetical protein
MTIQTTSTPQVKFNDFDAALAYTANKSTEYIPIDYNSLYMNNYFTINGFDFTNDGIESISRAIEVPSLGKVLHTSTIDDDDAPNYFNSIMNTQDSKRKLKNKYLVVQDGTIIGTVGSKYKPYDNNQYLEDIHKILPSDYKFIDGNIVGSKIRVNFGSEYNSFDVKGRTDDKIIPGVQLRSSMVGDTVIGALVRLHRLVCLNGMSITDNKSDGRAYHVGDDLKAKLDLLMERTSSSLKMVQERIDQLIGMPYVPKQTAKSLIKLNAPFKILPEHKKRGLWYNPKKKYKDISEHNSALDSSISMLDRTPLRDTCPISKRMFESPFKVPMMFDFVESFTESAQRYSIEDQNLMEEEAGVLSTHIYNNSSLYC